MNKDMPKENQELTLLEIEQIINETIQSIREDDEKLIKKNWGGELDPEEEFSPEDFFGIAGDSAEQDIKDEYGEDEFASFGSMEDPRMLKDLDEDSEQKALFKPQDAEGNDISKKALVKHVDSDKTGRVVGLGDNGKGDMIIIVDWQWPIDMKFTAPEEMGKERIDPKQVIVTNKNTKEMKNKLGEEENADRLPDDNVDTGAALYNAIVNFHNADGTKDTLMQHVNSIFEDNELEESGRGLGKGVKNSGDRNVKMRDDNHSAPLTNLNESINSNIKNLTESSITKKQLQNFITEEARRIAKNLKG